MLQENDKHPSINNADDYYWYLGVWKYAQNWNFNMDLKWLVKVLFDYKYLLLCEHFLWIKLRNYDLINKMQRQQSSCSLFLTQYIHVWTQIHNYKKHIRHILSMGFVSSSFIHYYKPMKLETRNPRRCIFSTEIFVKYLKIKFCSIHRVQI